MRQRPQQERPSRLRKLAWLAAAFFLCAGGLTTAALATTATAAGASTLAQACASQPGQAGCALTAISLSTGSLVNCSTGCELDVGVTAELTIEGTYNDGSAGPLSVVAAGGGPQASLSTAPQPSGAFTLSGVVNGAGAVDEVQLTADEATSTPAVVEATYQGLDAFSPPITAVVSPTCGVGSLPECIEVNGALLNVAAVLTGTAGNAVPVAGAVADIVQAGPASGAGAFTSDQPCYPAVGGDTCGPVPAGDPTTAPASTCTTLSTGPCSLTAMWDGSAENFQGPDTVTLYPPPGYVVAGVSGCAPVSAPLSAPSPALTCDLTVPDASNPLSITFGLLPFPVLAVSLAGPVEPACPAICSGQTYDNDAVDGTVVTASPTGTTPGEPVSCQVEGGAPGDNVASGHVASCVLTLLAGTYSLSLPATISTPASEVGIALAYVTSQDPEQVSLTPGQAEDVGFASAYEPVITVNVAGPLEPCLPGTCLTGTKVYDNDALDGALVTVTPTDGTPGSPVTCQLQGGYPGDNVDYGAPASCNANVPPGTYSVSLPPTLQTTYSEVGIPVAYVSGANSQTVTISAGNDQDVSFATVYEPTVTVILAGPLEPSCAAGNCATENMVYDNDAVDGTTVTVTPSGGTVGTPQTCELEGGYPGDNVDYGQPASCTVGEPSGTYSVSLPSTLDTTYSEVGIPLAYVTGQDPQSVTLTAGENEDVNFTSAYEPTIDISLAGPLEPGCGSGPCSTAGKVYDDDAVNGTTVTVKPAGSTSGSTMTCEVEGGEPDGTAGSRQEASCVVGVPPGTYKVSAPARVTPSPDYGWGFIDVTGADPQQVTVTSGGGSTASFATSYEAIDNVGSGPGSARTKDGLLTASATGGTGTVTVGEYRLDPEGPPTFNGYSSTNDFFDVSVSPTSAFGELVLTVCGLNGNADSMAWWDTASAGGGGAWETVAPVSAVRSLKPGCLTASLSESTSPAISQLSGTVFGVALGLEAQRVSFVAAGPSSAAVGGSYKPRAQASSKLPVAFSVDSSSGKGACSLSATGTLRFTAAGTCVLDASQVGNSHWAAAVVKRAISIAAGKPVAQDAAYSTPVGRALKVPAARGVLVKDTVNGATIFSHSSPAHGLLTLLGNGSFTYVPSPSFSGTDSFTYTLRNDLGRSTATISIDIGHVHPARSPEKSR